MSARKLGAGRFLAIAGIALLVAALAIGIKGWMDGRTRQSESSEVASSVLSKLDEVGTPASGGESTIVPANLPVLELEDTDIAGRLQISSIALDLPVAASKDAAGLLPYLSSERSSSLAIKGESYEGEGAFGKIDSLAAGAVVTFTEMDGKCARFRVMGSGTTSEEFNDSYDLIMYWTDAFGTKHWAGCSLAS